MPVILLILALLAALPPSSAQSAGSGLARDTARGAQSARLSVEALCAQLTLAEVAAIMGKQYARRPESEKTYQVCTYGDSKEKGALKVRYFSLGSSRLQEAGWRKFVEVEAKGKVVARDGVLVSRFRKNKFGTDSIWFKDRQGHALELNVNAGVSEDQAVALAKAAMD